MRKLRERLLHLTGFSQKVDRLVVEIQSQYSASIPVESFYRCRNGLSLTNRARFDDRLRQLGYVIIGLAGDPNGKDVAVDISVADRLGAPIMLRPQQADKDSTWKTRDGEEVNEFSTSPDSLRLFLTLSPRGSFA